MGYGNWTRESFVNYSASKGRAVTSDGNLDRDLTEQQLFTQRRLHPMLDPKNVVRECRDSEDHPATVPVILALDVTGSMGAASAEVAKKMNQVMLALYDRIKDVEFLVMGIGDLSYDRAPIQMSQFESDIRIAEQLDMVYLEHGGGGNAFESYTAAWYMGLHHTDLDAWKRGRKGLIITMGDEPLNPYLPAKPLAAAVGDGLQADVETRDLYREVTEKYDVYHLNVIHRSYEKPGIEKSFRKYLDQDHFMTVNMDSISGTITEIITNSAGESKKTWNPIDRVKTMIAW